MTNCASCCISMITQCSSSGSPIIMLFLWKLQRGYHFLMLHMSNDVLINYELMLTDYAFPFAMNTVTGFHIHIYLTYLQHIRRNEAAGKIWLESSYCLLLSAQWWELFYLSTCMCVEQPCFLQFLRRYHIQNVKFIPTTNILYEALDFKPVSTIRGVASKLVFGHDWCCLKKHNCNFWSKKVLLKQFKCLVTILLLSLEGKACF